MIGGFGVKPPYKRFATPNKIKLKGTSARDETQDFTSLYIG
ncbi:hypothetical protein CRENPOLYSF1_470048 [Crenothrix polyspora]|uniref:Uncharacterized protein n=1 Tax=Crenothrix polyspora TaxID=360316 RepID=A0A1R4HC03_9GAMM|nr:hypothetical protein CRENPOLYSF1_470048 [Crenothrix polyspora]